jgi:hypothetical protein
MHEDREKLLTVLRQMPDEAFGYLLLALLPHAAAEGATCQIWPDGIGGFTEPAAMSISEARDCARDLVWAQRGMKAPS